MKTIMIVDDEKDGRELLIYYIKKLFESLAIPDKVMPEIIEAKDGPHAWHLLTEDKIIPDLMIIDFNMPGMNGDQLIDKIQKELPINPEIVMHSDGLRAEKEAQKRGCQFIYKVGGQRKIFDLAVGLGIFVP